MWIAIILAVFFCVLWIVERWKNREVKNLNVARENADVYVREKEQEAESVQTELQKQRAALEDMERTLERKKLEARAYCDEKTRNADLYFKKRNAEADALVGKARKDAQAYYEQKVSEADRYIQEKTNEAEQFAAQKAQEAQAYFGQKISEADRYAQEKADETERLATQKTQVAHTYCLQKTSVADRYAHEKADDAERLSAQNSQEIQAYFKTKIARVDLYMQLRAMRAERILDEKRRGTISYFKQKTANADLYMQEKRTEADKYLAKRRREADLYYSGKVSSADLYFKTKAEEAEHFLAAQKREAERTAERKRNEANLYYSQKVSEIERISEQRQQEVLASCQQRTALADQQVKDAETRLSEMQEMLRALQAEVDLLSEKTLVELTSIEPYAALSSHEIKNKLALLKTEEDELVKSGEALLITTNGFIQKRILDSRKKQILRCFHAESSMHIGSITAKNVDTIRARLQRSFQTINTLFSANGVQISQGMLALKLEELSLVYAYMLKIEDEKEKKKIIQAQLREEERVRREMEEEKKKIEKEIRQFSAEVKKLMDYMQKSSSDAEKQLYIDKINGLEEKLKALNADKEHVLEREQNTRAGFVYIISNIGSFGENIYKIGMTRRLEPMDRISELSSASVPFPFDIHAMIFSEDAPALETLLHRHFADRQVNKVNARKEFFKVDLEEIKQLVLTHHNATVHFVDMPEAAEYRETLQLEAAQSPA